MANAIEAANEKLTAGSLSGGTGATEDHALGGRVGRFASGGQYTDTVNAQLSPGEYVVNAGAARQWYSQLQGINAGQRPTLGNVDNSFNVGDIHVNGGATNEKTASAMLDALKRAQRRGTGRNLN